MIKLVFDNELLKEARMEMGLSQQELADIIGVKVHSIYNWESGAFEPCEENIIKLSQLFNIEIAQFLIKKHIEEDNKEKNKICFHKGTKTRTYAFTKRTWRITECYKYYYIKVGVREKRNQ